jgi:zinc and cadmium transporter
MVFEALLASVGVALLSLSGVILFGQNKKLVGIERYVIPIAVGIFLGLVLYELLPEVFSEAGQTGGILVAGGFIAFYILSSYLHRRHHHHEDEACARRNAATMVLVGDAIHNLADGFVLGAAFLIDPAIGVTTALALALHEIPQEIVEFGILLRGGYTKMQAAMLNLLSASSIVLGTSIVLLVSEHASDYVWVFAAIAAGNLLYIAACELLPREHRNLLHYQSIWHSAISIIMGFMFIVAVVAFAHDISPHEDDGHAYEATGNSTRE